MDLAIVFAMSLSYLSVFPGHMTLKNKYRSESIAGFGTRPLQLIN